MEHPYIHGEASADNVELSPFKDLINDDQPEACTVLTVAFPRVGTQARERRQMLAAAQFYRVRLNEARQTKKSVRAVVARNLGVRPKRVEEVLGRPIAQIFEVWQTDVEGTVPRTIVLT